MIGGFIFCDRCGKEIKGCSPGTKVQVNFQGGWPDYSVLLCEKCFMEFHSLEEKFTAFRKKATAYSTKDFARHLLEEAKEDSHESL